MSYAIIFFARRDGNLFFRSRPSKKSSFVMDYNLTIIKLTNSFWKLFIYDNRHFNEVVYCTLWLWVATKRKIFVFRFFSIFRFSAKNGGRKMKNGFSSFFAPFCPKFWLFLVIFSKYHNVFSITHSAYLKKMKKNEENPYLEIFGQKFFKNGSNFDDFSR